MRATQPDERLAPLYGLLARADLMTPHRFLEAILSGEMDGRRKLLLRLGKEALDPVEELLTAALGFEGLATPTLAAASSTGSTGAMSRSCAMPRSRGTRCA